MRDDLLSIVSFMLSFSAETCISSVSDWSVFYTFRFVLDDGREKVTGTHQLRLAGVFSVALFVSRLSFCLG